MFSGSFVDVVYSAYYCYTVNQKKNTKKRGSLFLSITLANLNRFL